jgi:hypothetical protein
MHFRDWVKHFFSGGLCHAFLASFFLFLGWKKWFKYDVENLSTVQKEIYSAATVQLRLHQSYAAPCSSGIATNFASRPKILQNNSKSAPDTIVGR